MTGFRQVVAEEAGLDEPAGFAEPAASVESPAPDRVGGDQVPLGRVKGAHKKA